MLEDHIRQVPGSRVLCFCFGEITGERLAAREGPGKNPLDEMCSEQVFGIQSRDQSRDGASVGIPSEKLASSQENQVMMMP